MRRWILLPLQLLRLLAAGAGTITLWILWLSLAIIAVYQTSIVVRREFVVPGWVQHRIDAQLAESGLALSAGSISFDPTGRAVIQDLVLADLTSHEPLVTVRAAYVELDPLLLLTRRVEIRAFEFSGASLHLPAIRSPSGRNEAVLESVAGRLRPSGNRILIEGLSGRLGGVDIILTGSILQPTLSSRASGSSSRRAAVADLRTAWIRTARQVLESRAQLERLHSPRVTLEVSQTGPRTFRLHADVSANEVTDEPARRIQTGAIQLKGEVALDLDGKSPFTVELSTSKATLPGALTVANLSARASGLFAPGSWTPQVDQLEFAAESMTRGALTFHQPTVRTTLATLSSTASFRCAGEPWSLFVETCDPANGRLRARAAGRVNAEHLRLAETLSGKALGPLLQLASRPSLEIEVALEDGWKLRRAEGRFEAGAVTARGVPLDGASATFHLVGNDVTVDDIVLRQGPSLARGSYAMDLATRDFRFLLQGRLQPTGIAGWFKDWWPRFWSNFEFTEELPTADVDVRGRWGAPSETTVYVGARNGRTTIRGTLFDSIATRVFVRPHFYDVCFFRGTQGQRSATGQFSRLIDPESRALSRIEFSAISDLDLTEGARVLGEEVEAVVAPFRMSRPTRLEVDGTITGPAAPKGAGRQISVRASSGGDFLFYEFPLSGITATIKVQDDDIVVDPVSAGFAGGQAAGRIHLSGRGDAQRLGFDVQLKNAVLGQAIRNLEEFSARRNRQPPPQENRFQQRIASGQLDLDLSADGRFADLFSYQGEGNAELRGADLGEVRLLWVLSEVLDKTLLNFSTLKLDTVRTNFALQGRKLAFSNVRITGPRAAIEAQGDYFLDRKSLDMKAKLFPFEESKNLFGAAVGLVFSPFSQALEFRLTGPLDKPSWAFVFGPTSMLRTITGNGRSESAPSP